jgi:hypothetical protein
VEQRDNRYFPNRFELNIVTKANHHKNAVFPVPVLERLRSEREMQKLSR